MKAQLLEEMTIKEKVKKILSWTIVNSIQDNKKLLFPNARLAWNFVEGIFA